MCMSVLRTPTNVVATMSTSLSDPEAKAVHMGVAASRSMAADHSDHAQVFDIQVAGLGYSPLPSTYQGAILRPKGPKLRQPR